MNRQEKEKINQVLSQLNFKQQLEFLIQNFPDNYSRMIKCRNDLYQFVIKSTPKLNDPKYSLATKCYWILHDLNEFPRCSNPECSIHNGKVFDGNIKFNVGYPSQCKECNNKKNSPRRLHAIKTFYDRYGSYTNMGTDTFKKQAITSFIRHYGVPNNMQSIEGKRTLEDSILKKYGVRNAMQNPEIRKKAQTRYFYNNISFDSLPELAIYVWLKDNKDKEQYEYQPNISFKYTFNGNTHIYQPDFMIDGKYYEFKGLHFFKDKDSNKEMVNPYDHSQDSLYEAKHQCMIRNNIIILTNASKYIDYLSRKFSSETILSFRKNQEIILI